MSIETARAFFEKINLDEDLQAKLNAIQSEFAPHIVREVLEIATEAGFEFTADDLKGLIAIREELSEEELDAISGGIRTFAGLVRDRSPSYANLPDSSLPPPG